MSTSDEHTFPPYLSGVIVGLIDVQLMLLQTICIQTELEPAHLAETLGFLTEQAKRMGGPADYVAGRLYAAESLRTMLKNSRLKSKPQAKRRPILELIEGDLMRNPGHNNDDDGRKNEE